MNWEEVLKFLGVFSGISVFVIAIGTPLAFLIHWMAEEWWKS